MDDDTGKQGGTPPDSMLPYDQWMEQSLRGVVARAITHAVTEGLPGQHHYYITFRTDFPGVIIPPRLLAKYPEEMTIVLQHQFKDLYYDEATRIFGVSLSFGGVSSPLTVPLDAVSAFVDPHVQYGLRFSVSPTKTQIVLAPIPEQPPEPAAPPAEDITPQVVSLDAFRRRRD